MAILICPMPALCSDDAVSISLMMALTRVIDSRISRIVSPERVTSVAPDSIRPVDSPIRSLISFAARRAALRKRTHFARDHRKTAAVLTGTRRFDRSVERENIRLERNAFDHADDIADLVRVANDVFHRADHVAREIAALARQRRRTRCQRTRDLRVI